MEYNVEFEAVESVVCLVELIYALDVFSCRLQSGCDLNDVGPIKFFEVFPRCGSIVLALFVFEVLCWVLV